MFPSESMAMAPEWVISENAEITLHGPFKWMLIKEVESQCMLISCSVLNLILPKFCRVNREGTTLWHGRRSHEIGNY